MKATELRHGNLINIGGNTLGTYQSYKPTKVTLAILNEIFRENEERPNAVLSVFQPIPITEECLIKYGFKSDSITGIYVKYRKGYFELWYDTNDQTYMCDNIKNMRVYIKYVHQLQTFILR